MTAKDRRFERKVNPNLCGAGERSDMKEQIDEIACEMALDEYSQELDSLPRKTREKLYLSATQEWHDRQAAKAERLEDR